MGSTSPSEFPSWQRIWRTPISFRAAATCGCSIPASGRPNKRRRINVEVTRWLNECLGLNLTDAFCGFKAYRTSALKQFEITDDGYAMPLQVWVQAVALRMKIVEVAVPLIYLDESRAFGGALDDADYRLKHYRRVFEEALERAGLLARGRVFGMTARRLRAPAIDGGVLMEPPASAVAGSNRGQRPSVG